MTDARLTQAALEQWLTTNPQLQLTQTAVEHWATVPTTSVQAVVTQIALEQWVSVPADTGGGGGPVVPGPSDPTWDVPTPTGVLQGVAAFNWDGAAWQPTGRAGPSVATPTGILQGVAAFSGGPSWAPTGRAGPGVATPTGVLDGVAVYTWSGSQWTPPGGTETVPTPTGGLRGVAAFDWDGTAWQPAAQARSSVPTPYGVLDGVARFGWTGSAWAATGAPSLSLDFMTPGTLDPRVTFTRASTATYTDAAGTIQTAATDAPRWDYDPVTHALRGVLIEEARTNLLLQSGNLANAAWTAGGSAGAPVVTANNAIAPDGTLTAARIAYPAVSGGTYSNVNQGANPPATAPYVYSMWLRGSVGGEQVALTVTPNGVAFNVAVATLTLNWQRFTLVIPSLAAGGYFWQIGVDLRDGVETPKAAQTIYAWGAQSEAGAFSTSYIPTTTATVARAFDNCFIASANMTPWFAGPGGTWFVEFVDNTAIGTSPRIIGIHSAAGITPLWVGGGNVLASYDLNMVQTANAIVLGAVSKGASSWAPGTGRACLNGGAIASAAMTDGFASLATSGVGILGGNPGAVNESMTGYARRVQYWPRVLSDAEIRQVTT